MSTLISQLINFGVPVETLVLLLMVPITLTFIAFCRQVIGVRGFGIFPPLILTFAFVETKLKYGIVIFFVTIITGTVVRFLLRKLRITYLPRMAIILTFVSLSVFLVFFVGSYFNIGGLRVISIFPILVMILLCERFISAQMERGPRMAIILTVETLILAIISYFIIEWSWLQNILLSWPILSFVFAIIINFALGRWTGLRFSEYFRFKELLR
ncbi:MAG: 7TM domain-containing protein [Candidatus Pacebacteria bacterium]|nr:7TM domain-containing protein [Candidatus Paceibacterota bacterium]